MNARKENLPKGIYVTYNKEVVSDGKGSGMTVCRSQIKIDKSRYTGILLCAVPNADKLPLKYFAKKKQFIGNRYMGSGWKRNLRKRKFIA